MVKSWDLADLVMKLKANGLVMVEKEAKDATVAILSWVEESLLLDGSMVGKLAAPAIELVKPMILNLEDKIDGIAND